MNANGGTGFLLYSIDNGTTFQAANQFTNLSAGLYEIVVKDANGCITTSTVNINEPAVISLNIDLITETCSNSNGSIYVLASGGTGAFQYSIDSGTTYQSSENFNNLSASNYSIIVQDANGCTQTGNAIVPNAPSPTITLVNSSDLTCFGSNDGTISVAASGGSGVLQYSINGGVTFQTQNSFSGLAIGNYNIVVQDTNNCTALSATSIIQPAALSLNYTTVQAICGNSNGSLTLVAAGGNGIFQYSIDSGITFITGNVFTGLAASNYNVVVQDGAGCSIESSIAVSNAQSPVITAVLIDDATCFGMVNGSITINANGGIGILQYSINNGVTYQLGNVFDSLPAGNYNLVVIDSNECQVISNALITEPPQIIVNTLSLEASCGNSDGTVTVNASGGMGNLEFSIDSITFQTGNIFGNLGAGNYNIIVQDATGCQVVDIASVSNLNGPVITGTTSNDLTCFGSDDGTITVNATGGIGALSYSIDNGDSYQLTNSYSNLPGGSYSIIVLDSNNCIASDGVIINEPAPVLFNTLVTDVTCGNANGVIDIYATGGTGTLVYSIDSGLTYQAGTIYNNLLPGNYSVFVQDANACSSSANSVINDLISPSIASINVTNVSCYGGSNGTAILTLTGGASPFIYQWSCGATAQVTGGLPAGNYTVTVTDADLCTATQTFIITEPPVLTTTTSTLAVSCFGFGDGELTAVTSGGTSPYSYQWSSGGTNATETNLTAGIYTVQIIDSNGCELSITDSVATPSELLANSASTPINCFGYNNGAVSTSVSGGTLPYSYVWSNGDVASSISNVAGGNYMVTITDNNNCVVNLSASVFEPPLLSLAVSGNDTICITQQAMLSAAASGGTTPYVYSWNNGITSSSQIVSPVVTTSYYIGVTDANGCSVSPLPLTVFVNAPLMAIASDDIAICDQESATISVTATGGSGGPYNYLWDFNGSTNSSAVVSPSQSTTYTVTVSDNCGTPAVSDVVTVIVNPLPQVNFTPLPPSGCVPLVVTFIDSTITEGGSTYQWNFGDGNADSLYQNPVHTYYEPGSYDVSLTVTSPFGCVSSLTQFDAVIVHDLPVAEFTPDPSRTSILNPHINFTDLSYDANSWDWDFGDGSGSSNDQNPRYTYQDTGTYIITLYISNQFGCLDTSYEMVIIDGDFTMYIPNAFTPNGDGINEFFIPQGIGIDQMTMFIFDRWGQTVFSSGSLQETWDGTHMNNNTACAEDVYIYVIRATDIFARGHEFTGRVSLVR